MQPDDPRLTTAPEPATRLARLIADREATVAIIGLGYVGLPLAHAVHAAGFRVIGFDVDPTKIERLSRGEGYLKHLGADLTRKLASSERFTPTADESGIAPADIIVLCVPTPLGAHRDPDLTYVERSAAMVGRVIRDDRARLVALESTTYPGTTRETLVAALTNEGGVGEDEIGQRVFVAYSPEREDPGRPGVTTAQIPKLVGGVDPIGSALAASFYRAVVQTVHEVESAEVAEAAKLLENVYRAVNIALVNELKIVFDRLGIDVWQVIEAAKTKPFGFQAFYPGPGLGGHCIPIDPFYLAWKAKSVGHNARFIELAGEINSAMPARVVDRLAEALNDDGKPVRGSSVLVLGIAYKPNVDDIRETPAAEIVRILGERGATVSYHDPHVPTFPAMRRYRFELASVELTPETLASADAVLVVTDHDAIDWRAVGQHARLIVDTRNAVSRMGQTRARVRRA